MKRILISSVILSVFLVSFFTLQAFADDVGAATGITGTQNQTETNETQNPIFVLPQDATILKTNYGQNYLDQVYSIPNNTIQYHVWQSYDPRLADSSGHYNLPYLVKDNGNSYIIASGHGTYVYDKNTCSIKFYSPTQNPNSLNNIINSISFTLQQTDNPNATSYDSSLINSVSCITDKTDDGNTLTITGTRTNSEVTFVTEYKMVADHAMTYDALLHNNGNSTHYYVITETQHGIPTNIKINFGNDDALSFTNNNELITDQLNNTGGFTYNNNGFYELGNSTQYLHKAHYTKNSDNTQDIYIDFMSKNPISQGDSFSVDPTFGYNTVNYFATFYPNNITSSSCSTGYSSYKYSTSTTFASIFTNSSSISGSCGVFLTQWNTTSIPVGSHIQSVNAKFDIDAQANSNTCQWKAYPGNWKTDSNSTVYTNIAVNAQTNFVLGSSLCQSVGSGKTLSLGSNAVSNLETNLSNHYFNAGIKFDTLARSAGTERYTHYANLQLQVVYVTTPLNPTLSKVNTLSTSSINATWVSQQYATWYLVFRESPTGGGFSQIANTTNQYYVDTGLSHGTQYNYEIFAGNQFGYNATAPSNQVSNYTITDAPTSLTTPTQSTSKIHLSWTAPSGTLTGYKIDRESPTGGGFSTLVANTGNTTTHYDNTGLTAGTQYNYRVSAINQGGTSAVSGTSSNYTITNAPTSLLANTVSTSRINLSWTAPSGTLTGYRIDRESPTGGGFSTLVANTGNTTTAYGNTGLTAGTQYNYKVFALNQGGTSAASGTKANYTLNVPPTSLVISQVTASSARVGWTNPSGNFSGFKVEDSTNNSTWSTITSNTNNSTNRYDLTGLTNGITYYTRISTNYDSTVTSPSLVKSFLTLNNPPTGVTGTVQSGSQILVSWVSPGNAITGYRIDVSVNGGGFTTLVNNTGTTATSYIHTGLTNGNTYSYQLYTYDATGISLASVASTPVTAGDVPSMIFAPGVTLNNTSPAILTWATPAANGHAIIGYRIDVSINSAPFIISVANTGTTSTTYSYSVASRTNYQWRIEAINDLGTGPLGTPSGIVTSGDAPTIPSSSSTPSSFLNLNTTAINLHMSSIPRNSSSYDAFTLNQDNWLWLKFDNTTTDSSTLGIGSGTVTGTTTYVPGVYNQAFSYNNSTKITYGNVLNFDGTSPFTFTGWVKSSETNHRQIVLSKASAFNTTGYSIRISSQNRMNFDLTNTISTNELSTQSSFSVNDGNWHYFAVTYGGCKLALCVHWYKDGVVDTSSNAAVNTLTGSVSNSVNFVTGDFASVTSPLNGQEDNIKAYPYELSASQVASDYVSSSPISSGKQFMSWYNGVAGSSTMTKKLGSGQSTLSLVCNLNTGNTPFIEPNGQNIYYSCTNSLNHANVINGSSIHDFSVTACTNPTYYPFITQIKSMEWCLTGNTADTNRLASISGGNQSFSSANSAVGQIYSNQEIGASITSTTANYNAFKFNFNNTSTQVLNANPCNINFNPTNLTKKLDSIACDPSVPAMAIKYWNGMMIQKIGGYNTNTTQQFLNSVDSSQYKKLLSLPCTVLVNEAPCITFILTDFSNTDTFIVLTSTHVYYVDAQTALFYLNNNQYGFQSYDIITQQTTNAYEIQNPILQALKLYNFGVNVTLNKAGLFTLPSGYTTKTTSIESAIRTIDPRWTNDGTDIPIVTSTGSLFPVVLTVTNAPSQSAIKVTSPSQVINAQEAVWSVAQLDATKTVEFDIPTGICVNVYIADISTAPSIWNSQGSICATGTSQKSIVYTNTLPLTFFSLPLGATHSYSSSSNILTTTVRSSTTPFTYTVVVKNSTGTAAINQTFTSTNALDQHSFNATGITKPAILSIYSGGNQVYTAYLGSPLSLASMASFFHTYFSYQGFDLLSFLPIVFASMFTRNTVSVGAAMTVVLIATLSWLSIVTIPDSTIPILAVVAGIVMVGYRGYQAYG